MAETCRWTRTFSEGATFSDDLGSLGIWVGPRTGAARRTHGQKEDYVLRRLLIAWKHVGSLRLPLTVQASDRVAPDFLLSDADGCRGLEVTEAGAQGLVDCDGTRVYADVLGDVPERIDIAADYDIDLARWARDQIDFLRQRKLERLDIENLIEELETLARRDRRELGSHLINLFAPLLKWQCQKQRRSGSWASTIENSCDEVAGLVEDSPSLRVLLHPSGDLVAKAYGAARRRAAMETGLSPDTFRILARGTRNSRGLAKNTASPTLCASFAGRSRSRRPQHGARFS